MTTIRPTKAQFRELNGWALGAGTLTKEWSNQDDDMVWIVRHSDKSICSHVAQAESKAAARKETVAAIIAYIKEYGDKVEVQDGQEVIFDGRKGYNQVGWLITKDVDNTIYMTSRGSSDGWDMSETYKLTDEDEGYGNGNNDIAQILASGKAASTKPFEI